MFDSVIRKLLSMFRTIWVWIYFSIVNFMKSKYKSISNEKLHLIWVYWRQTTAPFHIPITLLPLYHHKPTCYFPRCQATHTYAHLSLSENMEEVFGYLSLFLSRHLTFVYPKLPKSKGEKKRVDIVYCSHSEKEREREMAKIDFLHYFCGT